MIRDENTENDKARMSADLFRDRSPATMALDNLMRRELRVSDPTNANEIAEALGKLYEVDKEAMDREAAGMPFLRAPLSQGIPTAATCTSAELEQAKNDVESDLKALTTNSLLKDIEPELQGWASAIRKAVVDGVNAARFALDPNQRDKTFGIRRVLGNYARVARFVGALTPTLSPDYRQLAKSLDEVAGVLLVQMGEALANIGFGGGRFLLQAPVSELQERRDAAVYALRNLIGSTQEAYGPNDWPRGLHAYRGLRDRLSKNAQHDLRALFQENELARLMDDLIHHATGNTSDGLRALGSTAQISLERFRRLIVFTQGTLSPESPPVAAFLSALRLFLDAFENADSGYRLLKIARPPVLFYGLYGIGEQDDASQRLLSLIIERGKLANELDCYLGCDCSQDRVRCQIILDKILYDVDRAIDLYTLGRENFGEPEQRAAAYGYVIEVVKGFTKGRYCLPKQYYANNNESPRKQRAIVDGANNETISYTCRPTDLPCVPKGSNLEKILDNIKKELWFYDFEAIDFSGVENYLHCAFGTNQPVIPFDENLRNKLQLRDICDEANNTYEGIYGCMKKEFISQGIIADCEDDIPLERIPESIRRLENMLKIVEQELCFQMESEKSWRSLLETMTPSCIKFNGVLDPIHLVLNSAIESFTGITASCPPFKVDIPPHFETSLDTLANRVLNTGAGRESEI